MICKYTIQKSTTSYRQAYPASCLILSPVRRVLTGWMTSNALLLHCSFTRASTHLTAPTPLAWAQSFPSSRKMDSSPPTSLSLRSYKMLFATGLDATRPRKLPHQSFRPPFAVSLPPLWQWINHPTVTPFQTFRPFVFSVFKHFYPLN